MTRNILHIPSVYNFDHTPLSEIEKLMYDWDSVFDFTGTLKDIPTSSKYPKYELLKNKEFPNKNRIRICIAGMDQDSIKVSTLKNKLCIKYEKKEKNTEKSADYEVECVNNEPEFESVVNYISDRSFTQYFSAPESYLINVDSATIKDGILTIDTSMILPKDMQETQIKIDKIAA